MSSLRDACRDCETVIHLAALNADECTLDPEHALFVNTLGTLNLVRAASDECVMKIIYFSTAHVYGSPLSGEIDELLLTHPTHPYAITHRSAEDYILQNSNLDNLSGTVLRLSNGVGPPISADVNCWKLVANDLSRQAVESNEIVLRTSGLQQRNFVAISDIVTFIGRILDARQQEFKGQVINLGGPQSLTILQLAQLIQTRSEIILGKRPKLIVQKCANDDRIVNLNFRIDKARRLGFSPHVDIISELDATLVMCKEHFSK